MRLSYNERRRSLSLPDGRRKAAGRVMDLPEEPRYTEYPENMMIDTKLLEILACPACKGDVEYDAKNEKIICVDCGRKYPVKEGIPVMLVEESEAPAGTA